MFSSIPRRPLITFLIASIIVKIFPDIVLIGIITIFLYNNDTAQYLVEAIDKMVPTERSLSPLRNRKRHTGPRIPKDVPICTGHLRNGEMCHFRAVNGDKCRVHATKEASITES